MSEINYQALREKAEKATKGSYIVGHTSVNQHGNLTGVFVCQKWKGEPGGVWICPYISRHLLSLNPLQA
ncbi:ead/Ea22-like family protein, partial [Escherichia coli]|nr:ead/Ea22-like family protein [Escherichia coli]